MIQKQISIRDEREPEADGVQRWELLFKTVYDVHQSSTNVERLTRTELASPYTALRHFFGVESD